MSLAAPSSNEILTGDAASLLPAQHGKRPRSPMQPEARLMAAVLSQAVADFRRYASDDRPSSRHLYRLASEWIASRDTSWPYSFENICHAFDLEPHAVRRALVRDRARRDHRATAGAARTVELTPRDRSTQRVWEATGAKSRGRSLHPSAA